MNNHSKHNWIATLLGIVLIIAGVLGSYFSAGHMITGYLSTQHWESVPVTIRQLNLERRRGEETTYTVNAHYSYQYQGNTYSGNRVSISRGYDNIGRYWQDLHASLKNAIAIKEAIVFVNPENPSDAVLDRTLRWQLVVFGLVVLLVFGSIGCILLRLYWRRI